MSDGTPINVTVTPPVPNSQEPTPQAVVKIVSLPPDTPMNKTIAGEVVASDNGKVTIKTDQGMVVLESDIPVEIGQKINLKLQNIVQQANKTLVAELFNVLKTDKPVVQPNAPVMQPAVIPDDTVIVNTPKPVEAFTDLQARVVSLPQVLDDNAVEVLFKSLMNLPQDKPLPPTLQQGLVKFQALIALLSQANLLPAQALQPAVPQAEMQQQLLTSLQQLLNPPKGQPVANNPLLTQLPQNFIQLQTIMPGQNLSPNILLEIRQQLLTILQAAQIAVPPTVDPDMPLPLPVAGMPTAPIPTTQAPVYTMPAIGLVLGQQQTPLPTIQNANLVFMATPQAQQLIGLLSAPNNQPLQQPLLPGTVFVVAFEPRTQQIITLPLLPSGISTEPALLPALNLSLGDTWPALDALWDQALAQQLTAPDMMASLRQIIPAPTPQQMPPAVMLFLAIIKSGLTEQWINSEHFKGIGKIDKSAVLNQLAQDLRSIQTRLDDTLPADSWRPLPIPLQLGDQLVRLQFFYRHPDDSNQSSSSDEEHQQKKKNKTRFLLNVPKTAVGDIQIDGLVQFKDIEMILRTEQNLSSQMEGEIRERYQSVLETTGMAGNIHFQSGRHHYIHV